MRTALTLILASMLLASCASSGPAANQFGAMPVATVAGDVTPGNYIIGPLDTVSVTVFQVPDLTLKDIQVDAGGQLTLPLIGGIQAAGRTSTQLAADITQALNGRYLQSPQVSVSVSEAVSQKVTVDGAVIEPGVFQLKGRTTLLQAVAMAKGVSRNANLRQVAVFRVVEGKRSAAIFDLNAIRKGQADDPEVYANDVVVVDTSMLKSAMREIVTALPGLGVFRAY